MPLHLLWIFLCAVLLSACSESEPDDIGEPFPKADPVLRPYISDNGSLINLDVEASQVIKLGQVDDDGKVVPIKFEPVTLVHGENVEFMISLDTDASFSSTINDIKTFQHTTLPEFVLYTRGQQIFLYEFASRYNQPLIDFDALEDENVPFGQICDLRRAITPDAKAFEEEGKVIFKDELSAYVALDPSGDCSHPSQFFKLEIKTSEKARDEFIVEKTHVIRSASAEPVIDDELPQWLLNYSAYLDSDPTVENKKEFTAYEELLEKKNERTHTFKKYEAKLREETSALVYADAPIFDRTKMRMGFLGLDVEASQLRFFLHDVVTKRNTEIWQLEVDVSVGTNLLMPEVKHIENTLVGFENKPYRHYPSRQAILVELEGNIIRFSYDDLFNDDRQVERASRLSEPFFDRDYTLSSVLENVTLDVDYEADTVAILNKGNEDGTGKTIHYSKEGASPRLVKQMNEPNLTDFEIISSQTRIFISKRYGADAKALTVLQVDRTPAVESTLLPISSAASTRWELGRIGRTVVLNVANSGTTEIKAFDLSLLPPNNILSDNLYFKNSIFVKVKDSRFYADSNEYWGLLYSTVVNNAFNTRLNLSNPRLYKYVSRTPSNSTGRGTKIAYRTDLDTEFNDTLTPEIATLRIVSEQGKSTDIKEPYDLSTVGTNFRNFAQYDYNTTRNADRVTKYDPYFDTGFFPDPIEEIDDGTTDPVTGPDKPKVGGGD